MDVLNSYELRARFAPAIVVVFPLGIIIYSILSFTGQISNQLSQFLTGGAILLTLVYLFSFLVRHNGRKIEPELWSSWDGPPSTRIMRWRDTTIGEKTKSQAYAAVKHICGITLCSKAQEAEDEQLADNRISEAFNLVKTYVRKNNPEGLWDKHNAEYGFHRNLIGSRKLWLTFSLIGMLVDGIIWFLYRDNNHLGFVMLNALMLIGALVFGWFFLPKFAKASAERYAESVWTMFLVAADSEKK